MKKAILMMLIALMAGAASAETFDFLKFTRSDGTTLTCSVEGLMITYDDSNINVTNADGAQAIPLTEVLDMYFSNEDGTSGLRGDVNRDGEVNLADINAVISYLLGDADINPDDADCNQDGEVSITDIGSLLNYLLSGN